MTQLYSYLKCLLVFASTFLLQKSLAQEDTDESYSPSVAPTDVVCNNTPGWIYPASLTDKLLGNDDYTCDDPQVICSDVGAIGEFSNAYDKPASQHCCKCKEACTAAALCLTTAPTFSPAASSFSPTTSIEAEEIEKSNIVNTAIIVTIIGVLLIGCLCYKASQEALENRRDLSATRHAVSQRRGGRTEAPHPVDAAARREEILSHFFCQHVLPDKSNASLSSLRFTVKDAAEEKGEQEDFEDRQSPVESTTTNKQKRKTRRQSSASISSILMAATWRKPAPEDECCICLERYEPGDAICASKATECHHIFHQDCVLEWMMRNHDCCPLCRVNLME